MILTKKQLWKLRKEIRLNSRFCSDYRNSFGIDEHACCDFFDGFLNYLEEIMKEDGHADADDKFFDYLDDYDNAEYLWRWYLCLDYDCFPCMEIAA